MWPLAPWWYVKALYPVLSIYRTICVATGAGTVTAMVETDHITRPGRPAATITGLTEEIA
jgi:hypothetical protein